MRINGYDENNLRAATWNEIYSVGGWDGAGSGTGSLRANNTELIEWLDDVIVDYNIKRIVDIGCGDMQWIPAVLDDINYTGIDGSSVIIQQNQETLGWRYNFECHDIMSGAPDVEADLVFCKDLLQHNIYNSEVILSNIEDIAEHRVVVIPAWLVQHTPVGAALDSHGYLHVMDYVADELKSIYDFRS